MSSLHLDRDNLPQGSGRRGLPRGLHKGRGGVPRGRGISDLSDLRAGLHAQPAPVHLLVPQRQDGQLPRGERGEGGDLHHQPGDH